MNSDNNILEQILKLTKENNKILKELQTDGIAIHMPTDIEKTHNFITKEIKPKVSKDVKKIIQNNSEITAWEDIETGLTWEIKQKENRDKIFSYNELSTYVDNLNIIEYSGFHDWRIPTLNELKTLVTKTKYNFFHIKMALSLNTNYNYWTTTKYNEDFYMIVSFKTGKDNKSEKNNLDYVRCVRGELKQKS